MKKKKYIALIAALTLSSAFVLNGCSLAREFDSYLYEKVL